MHSWRLFSLFSYDVEKFNSNLDMSQSRFVVNTHTEVLIILKNKIELACF